MKLDETNLRACSSTEASIWLSIILLALLPFCVATQQTGSAQQHTVISAENSPLTTVQVVERLVGMNLLRAQALHSYLGTRTYRLEYRGVLGAKSAEMVVDVIYRAPGTKEFTIRSSTGSKLIIDKVFRKLLEAEEEALSTDGQRRTALTGENYEFTMVRYESKVLRPMYVLAVEPKSKSKFLFRGRVWVDAHDFAVIRLEAEPAKNPSIWTKSSQIEQVIPKSERFLASPTEPQLLFSPDWWACRIDNRISKLQNHGIKSGRPYAGAASRSFGRHNSFPESKRALEIIYSPADSCSWERDEF